MASDGASSTRCSRFDFKLDDAPWKDIFSQPGGLVGGCGCLSPVAFLAVRVAILAVWLGCVIWSTIDWIDYADYGYWWTKLTHWGAVIELAYFAFAAYSTYKAIFSSVADGLGDNTPWFVSVTWLLSAVTPVVSCIVAAMFWVLVYEPGPGKPEALSVVMHGGNLLLVIVDTLICRQPYYIQHVYIPLIFATAYALFTLVYYLAGGTNEDGTSPYIYSSIDWSQPGGTGRLLGLLVLIGVPIVYIIFFMIVVCRVQCRKSVDADKAEVDVESVTVVGKPEAVSPSSREIARGTAEC